jgi:hypothetical protein
MTWRAISGRPYGVVKGLDLQVKAFALEAAGACLAPVVTQLAQLPQPAAAAASTSSTSTSSAASLSASAASFTDNKPQNTNKSSSRINSSGNKKNAQLSSASAASAAAAVAAAHIPPLVGACQAVLDDPHTPPQLLPPLLKLLSVVGRCSLTVSKPVLKAPLLSALETII